VEALYSRTFRANPDYELVQAERLTPTDRSRLGGHLDAAMFGVLRPRSGTALGTRECTPDVALLFMALAEPGLIPAFARLRMGHDDERVLSRLVVDGVLEVATEGAFCSGPAAASLLLAPLTSEPPDRPAELSIAAVRYGQGLDSLPIGPLTRRLYAYGRRPVSPRLRRRMPDERCVDEFVGTTPDGTLGRYLGSGWAQAAGASGQWHAWRPRRTQRSSPRYKLYVSPAIDALPAVIETVATTLASSRGVVGLKIARGLAGITRPDKAVAYFDRLEDLQGDASRLAETSTGLPAHGVPFTAAIVPNGLLSWGADPPVSELPIRLSWRAWVAERLAEYLVAARTLDTRDGMEPWQFALHRLALAGVNTTTWTPASRLWRDALADG